MLTLDLMKLEFARLENGLSRRQLSQLSEVPNATVNRLFNGKNISPSSLKSIVETLGLKMCDVLTDKE